MRRPASTSSVKRWAIKLALYLLAGAVVTWGVAWGCAVAHRHLPNGAKKEIDVVRDNRVIAVGQTTRAVGVMSWYIRDAERTSVSYNYRTTPPLRHPVQVSDQPWMLMHGRAGFVCVTGYGWPWLSMFVREADFQKDPLAVGGPRAALLPIRLFPVGFALDTVLATGVLMGVVKTFASARRQRRRLKGRCPSCGYERGGLPEGAACPECGAVA